MESYILDILGLLAIIQRKHGRRLGSPMGWDRSDENSFEKSSSSK